MHKYEVRSSPTSRQLILNDKRAAGYSHGKGPSCCMFPHLQIVLARGLLGQHLAAEVVVLQVQVAGAAQPAVACDNHIGR
eukprot:365025-Chlamydomonas_euryale.AAC.14